MKKQFGSTFAGMSALITWILMPQKLGGGGGGGGPGTVVEIDEAKFGKCMYNRGRCREGKWVIGGIEKGTEDMFLQIVRTRDAKIAALERRQAADQQAPPTPSGLAASNILLDRRQTVSPGLRLCNC